MYTYIKIKNEEVKVAWFLVVKLNFELALFNHTESSLSLLRYLLEKIIGMGTKKKSSWQPLHWARKWTFYKGN